MAASGCYGNKSIAISTSFKTLAFLDIETTDLGENAEIWQLCVVAIKIDNFLGELPYEVHGRFNRFFKPFTDIHPDVVRLTGMTNENLKDERPIDSIARKDLKKFLEGLQAPVCLIAHNGNYFDFPLLKRDFADSFPPFIKLVDSIDLFKVYQSMYTYPGGVSFKLKDVHQRFFGEEPFIQHEASQDVETLIKCLLHVTRCPRMMYYNEHIIRSINRYCKTFRMIGGVSRGCGRKLL